MSNWSGRQPSGAQVPDGWFPEPAGAQPSADPWWPMRFQSGQPTGAAEPTPRHSRSGGRPGWSWADRTVLVYRAALAGLALWVVSGVFFDLGQLVSFAVLSAAGVLSVTVWSVVATSGRRAGPPGPFRLTVVTSQVMTAVVSAVLLAPQLPDAQVWSQVAHFVLPAGVLVDFVLLEPHRRLQARSCWWALAAPVVYFGVLGVTGGVAEVPYEIFKVRVLGWPLVAAHLASCLAVVASACAAVLAADCLLPARPLVGPQRGVR